jgi:hypothetical protein
MDWAEKSSLTVENFTLSPNLYQEEIKINCSSFQRPPYYLFMRVAPPPIT